jgi:E3 ubiquitin-protein ligase BAH
LTTHPYDPALLKSNMKFAHEYREHLEHSGFPTEWVDSALSYGQLKKCIKKVKRELASIGLDAETLQELLNSEEKRQTSLARREDEEDRGTAPPEEAEEARPLRYEFRDRTGRRGTMENGLSAPRQAYVRPMLLFLVDEQTGEPFDARLAPGTKNYIHQLALNARLTDVRVGELPPASLTRQSSDPGTLDQNGPRRPSRAHRLIEVPLTTDSEFFDQLQNELSSIAKLQTSEKDRLHADITTVGRSLAKATDPQHSKGRQDLAHWRRLFELYVDSRVFFATNERDHGLQNFVSAQKRYMLFIEKAQKLGLLSNFKKPESATALQSFLGINTRLLQNIRFVELNQTAMTKILKSKFSSTLFQLSQELTPARIRQKNRPIHKIHIPNQTTPLPPHIRHSKITFSPSLNGYPFRSSLLRRLSLPNLLRASMAPSSPTMSAHLLHPLPNPSATRRGRALSALS